ncbi:MAG TPA: site-2 protease family protein [Methylomirabilota bacterium]|jgi:Zn-dependent protease/predicted transcriptional regulator|nr:site-2 protease family protein [Methylomirabilota bacterium]
MGGTATLFRIFGIPVRAHVSWLAILGLLTWSLAVGYFPHVLPDVPLAGHWARGFLAALLLFASVLLHELSHSVAARRYGIPVSGITLHIFGGVSQLEREPDRPGAEFVIAIVGPITSLAIAALLALGSTLFHVPPGARAIMGYLTAVNVLVGVFNLIPGFPLDGGRLLRAALWKRKGDLQQATRMASRVGSAFALILMGIGALRAFAGEFMGGLWLVLIGLFLRQAAEGSYQQAVLRRALAPLAVRDVMTREVVHIPADLAVGRVLDDFFWRHHVSSFPVLDDGRVVGILSLDQLRQVSPERLADTRSREIMLPLAEGLMAAPGDSLWQAFEKLARNGLGRLAVLEGGRLVGYLSVKDVMHVLALSSGPRGRRAGR